MDLDFVLGVIADGPTKSFAFKRLQYLSSKFTMYMLLNEPAEVIEMKVGTIQILLPSLSLTHVHRTSLIVISTISEKLIPMYTTLAA